MKSNPHLVLASVICLLVVLVAAQEKEHRDKLPRRLVTASKAIPTNLAINKIEFIELSGRATFTVTSLNTDDSFTGNIIYTLSEESRSVIAQQAKQPISNVPQRIIQEDVVATLEEATECPVINLKFVAMDLKVAGEVIHFNRFILAIKEPPQEIAPILCSFARCLSRKLPECRYSRRINEWLYGEESK